jgi:RND family efflux transporter MFP subunit
VKRTLKILFPLLVVAAGAAVALTLYLRRPEPEKRQPQQAAPLVRVHTVELTDVRLTVPSQGTVTPRTESTLVPEVSGRILEVGPAFAAGGFFGRGDLLVRIDPLDHRQAVIRARARVAEAELRLAREQAEAEVAAREWQELGADGEPSPLTLRRPQVADAQAALAAAGADLELAERNLVRTEIRAPYAGRVRGKSVGVGQFVTTGTPLASIYAVDAAEVRLPLPGRELAYLDLPLGYRRAPGQPAGPPVTLQAEFAGRTHAWSGRIVRTEGEIDPRTRPA